MPPFRPIHRAVLALTVLAACSRAEPAAAPDPTPAPTAVMMPAPIPVTDGIAAVTIATTPTGATVRLSGADLGTTPYVLKYKTATTVDLSLDGYLDEQVHVDATSDPNIIVVLHVDPAATELTAVAAAPTPTRSASTPKTAKPTAAPPSAPPAPPASAPASDPEKPRASLPYPNVAAAKADYQAGKIDRDAYDQAVRKLKNRRSEKIAVIRAKYQAGEIDKDEYARRKRIIDNEYRGA